MTHGKVHNYMVNTIDLYKFVNLKITIIKYINSILNEAPINMDGDTASPGANHLFEV